MFHFLLWAHHIVVTAAGSVGWIVVDAVGILARRVGGGVGDGDAVGVSTAEQFLGGGQRRSVGGVLELYLTRQDETHVGDEGKHSDDHREHHRKDDGDSPLIPLSRHLTPAHVACL